METLCKQAVKDGSWSLCPARSPVRGDTHCFLSRAHATLCQHFPKFSPSWSRLVFLNKLFMIEIQGILKETAHVVFQSSLEKFSLLYFYYS